jgi:hypothetical protein
MKKSLPILVMIMIFFLSACNIESRAVVDTIVATEFTDTKAAEALILTPGTSTPKAVIQTLVATMVPSATISTICALHVVDFDFYEIIEGSYMTDAICDTVIPSIQAELNLFLNKNPTVIRVYSYPTSPIICDHVPVGRSTITLVDTNPDTSVSQTVCKSLQLRNP